MFDFYSFQVPSPPLSLHPTSGKPNNKTHMHQLWAGTNGNFKPAEKIQARLKKEGSSRLHPLATVKVPIHQSPLHRVSLSTKLKLFSLLSPPALHSMNDKLDFC